MQGHEGGAMVMMVLVGMVFDAWVGIGHTGPVGRGWPGVSVGIPLQLHRDGGGVAHLSKCPPFPASLGTNE